MESAQYRRLNTQIPKTVSIGASAPASSPAIDADRVPSVASRTAPPTIRIPRIPADMDSRQPFTIFITEVY